ncbi:MAG: large conductance mechanosensitive channel protein MscL [Lachnospiraceae bacterium]|nr:large conductance mechanosensitive channel protein MscL [Lachnospiraceae bacterium]
MKGLWNEFKDFINKGNALSMAVGIILGGAFTAIVTAIVENLITPLLGVICGGIDFAGLAITVGDASFGIGAVISAIITFFATAIVLFLILKGINSAQKAAESLKKKEAEEAAAAPAEPSEEVKLLMEIRDLMKK